MGFVLFLKKEQEPVSLKKNKNSFSFKKKAVSLNPACDKQHGAKTKWTSPCEILKVAKSLSTCGTRCQAKFLTYSCLSVILLVRVKE